MGGVLACSERGRYGPWHMEVDEEDKDGTLTLDILGPKFRLSITLASEDALGQAILVLRGLQPSVVLGSFHGCDVTLLQDEEFSDRFFLKVGPDLEFTLSEEGLTQFTGCLMDLVDDLNP